jgi:3-oxoacyl-[acyl-carrier protein] reductase
MSSSLIITGASSGIGRAVAQRLAKWEGHLVLSGRSRTRLDRTRTLVEKKGGKVSVFPGDLTHASTAQDLAAYAETQAPIYGVIMAAGIGGYGLVVDQSPSEWSRILEGNLLSAYYLSRAVLPFLNSRRNGHLVFINSVAGLKSFTGNSAYVAAKSGLRGFAETLRLETRESNIRITSIFPGATDTEWWEKEEGTFPRHAMLKPEEVAAAVEFVLDFRGRGVVEEMILRPIGGDF